MNSYAAAVKACVAVLVLGITGMIIEFQHAKYYVSMERHH
jgi:hypothetical protein